LAAHPLPIHIVICAVAKSLPFFLAAPSCLPEPFNGLLYISNHLLYVPQVWVHRTLLEKKKRGGTLQNPTKVERGKVHPPKPSKRAKKQAVSTLMEPTRYKKCIMVLRFRVCLFLSPFSPLLNSELICSPQNALPSTPDAARAIVIGAATSQESGHKGGRQNDPSGWRRSYEKCYLCIHFSPKLWCFFQIFCGGVFFTLYIILQIS